MSPSPQLTSKGFGPFLRLTRIFVGGFRQTCAEIFNRECVQ